MTAPRRTARGIGGFLLLLLLILLLPPAAGAEELKVATWNLDWFTVRTTPIGLPADVRLRQPDDFERLAQYARDLDADVVAREKEVLADKARVQQVLVNLVTNAVRHTPPEASVTVTARAEGGWAVLEVADTGPGLEPGDEERVFEAFFRGDPSRQRDTGGSGLGLAIVAAIATAHDGTVSAGNRPEGGAVFTVRLPLAP